MSSSAARAALGLYCIGVVKMSPPIYMRAEYSSSGRASGQVEGLERLLEILYRRRLEFDAVAIDSRIDLSDGLLKEYFQSDGQMINPWGAWKLC